MLGGCPQKDASVDPASAAAAVSPASPASPTSPARTPRPTVSATLSGAAFVSEALQTRVREAIDRLGYFPDGIARSLKSG